MKRITKTLIRSLNEPQKYVTRKVVVKGTIGLLWMEMGSTCTTIEMAIVLDKAFSSFYLVEDT